MSDETNVQDESFYHDAETGRFLKPDGEEMPFKFFPNKGEFITSGGDTLKFKDYASRTLLDIQQRFEAKYEPVMPRIATEIGDGEYEWTSNPKDAGYLLAMEKYQIKIGILVMSLYFAFGVDYKLPKADKFPDDFKEMIALSFDTDNPYLKYHIKRKWFEAMMNSNEELDLFYSLLQGRKVPTWEGLSESAKRFQSAGERVSVAGSHVEATISTN